MSTRTGQSAAAERLLGVVLDGKYRVDALIGPGRAGGFIYSAYDVASQTRAAVRCPAVPADVTSDVLHRATSAFVEEADRLRRMGEASSDIEQLLAWGIVSVDDQPVPFTVFEWLEGRSLEAHLTEQAGGRSVFEAMAILEPAVRALSAAHAIGLSHGDVRPANLWLAEQADQTRIKLTQFVLASRIGDRPDTFAPEYGAPEHFKRSYGVVGAATDVYGLALCLVEIVSGKRALEGRDPTELYLSSSDLSKRPTLRARGAQVSDAVEVVLQRALAVDPKRRWPTARAFWDALAGVVPELTPAPPSVRGDAEPTAATEQATARAAGDATSTKAWLLVGVLAAIAIAIVVFRLGRGPSVTTAPSPSSTASAAPTVHPLPVLPAGTEETAVGLQPFLTDMVKIPPGTFTMGTDREGKGDGPAHQVTITKAFYIDRVEVTAEAYEACVEDGVCTRNRVHAGESAGESWGCATEKDKPRHPINCIDRTQAERYCGFVSKRLPTEAEWEYAARGADAREYPWGNSAPSQCTQAILMGLSGDCHDRRLPGDVGLTPDGKSPFGALDMAGNVWEWVSDGFEPYPSAAVTDPSVPVATNGRGVLRGGSWDYSPLSAKTTFRLPLAPNQSSVSSGVRCARDTQD